MKSPDSFALELIGLMQNELAGIDTQFQFWLTITFAVVVASFMARGQLGITVRVVVAALYLLATALLSARSLGHVELAIYLGGVLTEHGIDAPQTFSNLVGWLRRAVLTLGSISALIFILFPGKGDSPAAATTPKP